MSFLCEAHPTFKVHEIDTILWDYCQWFQALPTGDDEAATSYVGVYAIEGAGGSHDVMRAGAMLQGWTQLRSVPITLGTVATRDELLDHLGKWTSAEDTYGILYLRFPRADGNRLLLNDSGEAGATVGLAEVVSPIEDGVYSSENCVLHLGPCWPSSATDEDMKRFLERTGFSAISGYGNDVGWSDSLAFDLLYLERAAQAASGGLLTPDVMAGCRDVLEGELYGSLSRSLSFRLLVADV